MFGRIDVEDAILAPIFTLSAAVSAGITDVTIYGTDLGTTAYTLGSGTDPIATLSYSFFISVLALGGVILTNELHKGSGGMLNSLDDEEKYVVYAGGAAIFGLQFLQPVQDAIIGSDPLGTVVLLIEAAMFYALAYVA
jgi:hypothetical protein